MTVSRSTILPPALGLLGALLLASPAATRADLMNTRHNLTATGPPLAGQTAPSTTRETAGLCVFCHTPHNAKPTRGLWNRSLAPTVYKLYESSTLEAELNQPTGASRLCLSCHDGTLAMGSLRVPQRRVTLSLGPLRGPGLLGTDLSDDHPISFVYDRELAGRKKDLVDPANLPDDVKLDATEQLQCTTCHDAHEDKFGKFLVSDNRGSRLCASCHRFTGWPDSAHALSKAGASGGGNPWPHTGYGNVAENGCENCHRQHTAGHPEWLLLQAVESEVCLSCHRGTVASRDITVDFRAFSAHPIEANEGLHQPNEDPLSMSRHVTCQDCHEPHSTGSAAGGNRPAMEALGLVSGVDSSGSPVEVARAEYEVCYKCHGIQDASRFLIVRQDNVTNVRLQFSQGNASFHPVESIGRNGEISGLEAGYSASSLIQCSSCHSSQQSGRSQRTGGPHGSIYEPILAADYRLTDPSVESFQTYALCYSCHNRSALLSDTGGFPHRQHVADQRASCAVCHDAHGSRTSPFLINFLARGKDGNPVVTRSSTGEISFQSLGRGRGRCSLTCHGSDHVLMEYPQPITAGPGPMENMP